MSRVESSFRLPPSAFRLSARMILCAAIVLATAAAADAAYRYQFPYRAVVEGAEAYVRSGPGRNYYPTAKLTAGRRVTVHRHDPGGWYMIAPPKGSFSWIRADYVRKDGAGRGTLTANNVIVRVGSEFGNDRDVEQVRLSTGAGIEILGERTFTTRTGAVRMYQIVPPRGEYRWIRGRHLVPADRQNRRANDRDPYAIPTHASREIITRKHIGRPIDVHGPRLTAPGTTLGDGRHTTVDSTYDRECAQLTELDRRFRDMVDQDTASWDLASIEAEYKQLRLTSRDPVILGRIDRRLPTLAEYQSVQAEYQKTIQLAYETERRDAQLAGGSAGPTLATPLPDGAATSRPTFRRPLGAPPSPGPYRRQYRNHPAPLAPGVIDGSATSYPQPRRAHPGTRRDGFATSYPTPAAYSPQRSIPTRQSPQFDGAGIIKRVRPVRLGLPRYAIVAPDGRFLAYLAPVRGLPLERYVGRPMGIYGRRTHRPDLRGDYIVVRGMQPVRLLP
jgi:uncharacterized protein YraI